MEGLQKYGFNLDLSFQCMWLNATLQMSSEKLSNVSSAGENDSTYKIHIACNANYYFLSI